MSQKAASNSPARLMTVVTIHVVTWQPVNHSDWCPDWKLQIVSFSVLVDCFTFYWFYIIVANRD